MSPVVYKYSAWVLLIGGFALSGLQALQVRDDIEREARLALNTASDQVAARISDRILGLGLVLRAGAAVLASGSEPDRETWRNYVSELSLDLTLPGIARLGFVAAVDTTQLTAHEEALRAEGFSGYAVYPPALRETHAPVVFIEPMDEAGQGMLGFDMYSEAVRRIALEMARDNGDAVLSAPTSLDGNSDGEVATILAYPVYRKGTAPARESERREALLGWTYSPWQVTTLVNTILGDYRERWRDQFALQIYDGSEALPSALLYSSGEAAPFARGSMRRQIILELFNRRWLLAFDNSQAAGRLDYGPVWTRLGAGLTISVLLFGMLLNMYDNRHRSRAMAQELRTRLHSRERQLGESEARWKFVLDHTDEGIWEWDVSTETVNFSRRWRDLLGYGEHDLGTALAEWERRVHPEDLEAVKAAMRATLKGNKVSFQHEHRMLCKDGSWRRVRDSGLVVSRDREGRPLRVLGTLKDLGPA